MLACKLAYFSRQFIGHLRRQCVRRPCRNPPYTHSQKRSLTTAYVATFFSSSFSHTLRAKCRRPFSTFFLPCRPLKTLLGQTAHVLKKCVHTPPQNHPPAHWGLQKGTLLKAQLMGSDRTAANSRSTSHASLETRLLNRAAVTASMSRQRASRYAGALRNR